MVTVLSYDYETLEDDQAAAHEVMTSDYRKKLRRAVRGDRGERSLDATEVGVEVVASSLVRADGRGPGGGAGLRRPADDQQGTRQPVVYSDQATLTMERVGGEWLVDDVVDQPGRAVAAAGRGPVPSGTDAPESAFRLT